MDEAVNGVILFSLGTYIPDQLRSEKYFIMIANVFKTLKQKVLWKSNKQDLENVPGNVKMVKWLPQQDVLGTCQLFVSGV